MYPPSPTRGTCVLMLLMIGLGLLSCGTREDVEQTKAQSAEYTPLPEDARPNVVWILLDTLRSDHLGAYGYERDTSPNIDGLAERGVLFERHFSQGPNTLFSVPTYMTGRYFPAFLQDAHHLDIWFLRSPPKDEVLVSQIFSQNGYETGMFSSSPWYSKKSRIATSFDYFEEIVPPHEVKTSDFRAQNPGVFDWIREHDEKPFFAYIHTLDAHEPHHEYTTRDTWLNPSFPPERDAQLRQWTGSPFSPDDVARIGDLYDGGVAYADYTVGEILSHLVELGIMEDTVVIISSDHGEILGSDGITIGHPAKGETDELFRVPFVISGPGLPSGIRFNQRTQNVDIVPTLVEYLNLDTHGVFDGLSLIPVISGQEDNEIHEFVYTKSQHTTLIREPRHILYENDSKHVSEFLFDAGKLKDPVDIPRGIVTFGVPDIVDSRVLAQPTSDAGKSVLDFLIQEIAPRWSSFETLPRETPTLFQVSHKKIFMKGIWTESIDPADGLWSRSKAGDTIDSTYSDYYVAFNDTESAPRISGIFNVTPNRYRVSIRASTYPVDGVQRATSFRFNTVSPPKFKLYRVEPDSSSERTEMWIDLGEFDLYQGRFYYHIEPGLPEDLSVIGGLRFQVILDSGAVEEVTDLDQINEELGALGYVN